MVSQNPVRIKIHSYILNLSIYIKGYTLNANIRSSIVIRSYNFHDFDLIRSLSLYLHHVSVQHHHPISIRLSPAVLQQHRPKVME